MADAIERLYKLTVDANQAIAQLEKLNRNTDRAAKGVEDFASGLKKAAGAFAGAFAVDVVVDRFKAVVDGMDDIVKASQEVGVSAENLQALRYAAEASGASAEELDKGMQKLSQNLQDVEAGTTDAARALKAMGVTSKDTADQAFAKISDAFAKLPDGAQKTALAVDIFGKAGAKLIPTLNAGAAGLSDFAKEARELGLVVSTETLKAAEHFNDQLDMLGNMAKASAQQFVGGMLPALQAVADVLIDAKKDGADFNEWGKTAGELFLWLAKGAAIAATAFKDTVRVLGAVGEALADPLDAGFVWDRLTTDLATNNEKLAQTLLDLDNKAKAYAESQKAFVGPMPETTAKVLKLADAVGKLSDAQQHAADMMKVHQAAAKANADEEERAAKAADDRAKSERAVTDALHMSEAGLRDAKKASEEAFDVEQKRLALLDGYTQLLQTGDEWQKKFAASQIVMLDPAKKQIELTKKQSEELEALGSGFDRFVETLSSGSVTAAQAFKAMAQSIIADLLKIWAKKFILQTLMRLFTGGSADTGQGLGSDSVSGLGNLFAAGRVVPFGRGGVLTSPVRLPMALMAEAGPEAVMPLRRAADGRLGVEASGGSAQALNVQIQNFTDASISARRDGSGDLQILVEATKKSLAADVRRGGTDFSRAAEAAWRLSRGTAAPF